MAPEPFGPATAAPKSASLRERIQDRFAAVGNSGALSRFGQAIGASLARDFGPTKQPFEVRAGQVLAALLLVAIVPIGMVATEVVHDVVEDVLTDIGLGGIPGFSILMFLISMALIFAMVWLFFVWVRSAGFGLFIFGKRSKA